MGQIATLWALEGNPFDPWYYGQSPSDPDNNGNKIYYGQGWYYGATDTVWTQEDT